MIWSYDTRMKETSDTVHILLCGFYFRGNTGDDLFAESIARTLSPYGEVKVSSMSAFDTGLLDWCDILVIGAGSHITPRGLGGYEHTRYAKEKGKIVVFYSLTVEEGHPRLEEHLGRADLITVRDSASKKVVEKHGFRAVLASDPLFEKRRRKIGFSFRRWVNEPEGIEERLASVLDDLAGEYEILSVPYTGAETDTESDLSFHEKMIGKMRHKPVHVSYDEALKQIDLLIGMRLHALINAVNANKKVLAVDYDAKVGRIFHDLSLRDVVITYGEIEKIPSLVRERIFGADRLAQREKVNAALIGVLCDDLKGKPRPEISVVMPTFNRAHFLKDAVDSVLAQTFRGWELVVIDDGSTDGTQEVLEAYRDPRIRSYHFGHNGISFSRNIGNLLSRGAVIAVADSDDINLPPRLEVIRSEMEKSGAALVYSSMHLLYEDGRRELQESTPFSAEKLRAYNFLSHPTVAYRREVALACPYDEELDVSEDYHLYLSAVEKGFAFHRIREPLVLYRHHGGQATRLKQGRTREAHGELVEMNLKKGHAPAVSVIIPTCNRPAALREALASVLAQTYRSFEIIVVNDGGVDISEIVRSCNGEGKIVSLRHEERRGCSAARNTALRAAQGRYIAYLDDDDIYYPDHLETAVAFLVNTDCSVVYTDSLYATREWVHDRYVTTRTEVLFSRDFDREKLLVANYIPTINIVHNRDVFRDAGMFDESLITHEDWDLWIRMSRHYDFHHIKAITAEVRVRSDRTNTTTNRKAFLDTLRLLYRRYAPLVQDLQSFEERKKTEANLVREVEADMSRTIVREYELHHQYLFARELAAGKRVLHLGCGDGCGTSLLAESAREIVGVESDPELLHRAVSRSSMGNLRFVKGSPVSVPLPDGELFDVVVCLGIEAFPVGQESLLREAKRLLGKGGILVFSALNEDAYVSPLYKQGIVRDAFSVRSARDLLGRSFSHILAYGQRVYPASSLFSLASGPDVVREYVVERGGESFLSAPAGRREAHCLVLVASDAPLEEVRGTASYLVDASETLPTLQEKHIRNLEEAIQLKDAHGRALGNAVLQKDAHIAHLEETIRQKDASIGGLYRHIANLEEGIRGFEEHVKNV
ncbi:MAG: glycosyltransferase, partial [Nitrospirales bacterium]|nr:glycosyltransferase [Nitrospirales bacterium]